ncbi:nitrogenase iron protein NifH [Clostridium vitabionis]|jgi:nitrogenase iron protein NifH|uniref:nucleotide-binding protein n=1 Tax=Clostridium vitabionis TaxID=2784388 RepID=UPI00188B6674|nr:nitrogenase iron protein NifH [Clostridium vitabionis]
MYRFAIYGKGGIGKSTTATALSCAFARRGLRVFQIGCDPKADSTLYLHGGKRIPAILDVLREKRDLAELDDLIVTGYRGIICAESGGPMPGLGCAGRGIAAAFEALEEREAFSVLKPDVVIYDVLGDVVCGGFALPIREGYADQVYIVTSGENMAIYAAANIAMAVENFRERGYASVGGVILNRRNVPDEREKVETLCRDIHTEIAADLPRDNHIALAEEAGALAAERYPDCPYMQAVDALAARMLGHGIDRPLESGEGGL